ncbi:MAG: methyl-accepting chemotaxis protein [Planctomycetota bacterium]
MPHPKDLPIRQKILMIGLIPGCVGLIVACVVFVLTEKSDFRDAYTERLAVMAEIVAKNVGPKVAAGDRDAAERQLESLRADPHLISAVIHDREGALFAGTTFRNDGRNGGDDESLTIYHPVLHQGRPIGSVQVRTSLEVMNSKTVRYLWVTLIVLALSGGLALVIAMRLRRWISGPISHLASRMREVAEGEGDLTQGMRIDQDDEIGQFAEWFNSFLASQRDRVALIAGNARLLGASSDQMATISEQMSSNAEETSGQASIVNSASEKVSGNLQKVAAAAEQLHNGAREIAAHVSDSVHVADKAVREAGTTSDTLARLASSSDEIGAVVKVINSIAEQTNLLALNATIEAARAGESGKGFGVVASEVKELARGTANATEDIARRIQAIQDDTRAAVQAIERIGKVIHHIRGIQKEIATAMEEQTLTTNEIGKNVVEAARSSTDITSSMGGVADAARMTAAGVAETRRAAGELAQMAAELESLVARFTYEEPEKTIAQEIAQPAYAWEETS